MWNGAVQVQYRKLNAYAHRKDVIRAVVYDGTPVDEVAASLGVGRDTVFRALKRWGVALPLHLCKFPRGANWFEFKSRLSLPRRLKDLNRSEVERCYGEMTQTEMANRLMVSRRTIDRLLDYHCIPKRTARENYEFCRARDGLVHAAV
jgi:predicted DNA-binding protein (UPF0251 family)